MAGAGGRAPPGSGGSRTHRRRGVESRRSHPANRRAGPGARRRCSHPERGGSAHSTRPRRGVHAEAAASSGHHPLRRDAGTGRGGSGGRRVARRHHRDHRPGARLDRPRRSLAARPLSVGHPHRRRHGDLRGDGDHHGGADSGGRRSGDRIFPWFVLWFVAAAGINSLGLLPASLVRASGLAGKFLIVMVMAAVGFGADLRGMRRIGFGPFYIGLAASVLIAVAGMGLIRLLF